MRVWTLGVLVCCLSCSGGAPPPQTGSAGSDAPTALLLTPEQKLEAAWKQFSGSRYTDATKSFDELSNEPCCGDSANLGRAEVLLITGQYSEADRFARSLTAPSTFGRAREIAVLALMRSGQLEPAEALLLQSLSAPELPTEARWPLLVRLGEIRIQSGRRGEAEAPLMEIIEQYNEDVIKDDDGHAMFSVARAAELLRSPEDANEAYNHAEQALGAEPRAGTTFRSGWEQDLLLARGRLFLDNYDPGHAEEVASEVLSQAPMQPDALVQMAEVRLDQALDFEQAKRLAHQALATNPRHSRAHFILAGVALRDMKLDEALQHVMNGLSSNPNDVELLSMQAAAEFLADDTDALKASKERVLALNAEYSRFFSIVSEYAEWEHRYQEIVEMMREAVAIDPEDAKAHAQLGLNWIRGGDQERGVSSLQRAFSKDPYNVRVLNTLNLYEKVIPTEYTSETRAPFVFRFSKEEQPILSREVPPLLDVAWNQMVQSYEFTPKTPVGIELYYDRQHFAVRTSGLPQIAIQGVCFGQTLASMSPRTEEFNLGMTLWHELAHVFHIQLSKSHVPRWFTEGLAEYETLVARPEWKRERDAELAEALLNKRVPKIASMNEAFTHAENLMDVTVAYYASTQIVTMLVEQFGRPKLREMLVLWGQGKRHEEVFRIALGVNSQELDRRLEDFLKRRFARFSGQYFPLARTGDISQLQADVAKRPKDAVLHARLALTALEEGDQKVAKASIARAAKIEATHPDVRWVQARIAYTTSKEAEARRIVVGLIKDGHDGYEVQAFLARLSDAKTQHVEFKTALTKAHEFDPEQVEPLLSLARIAHEEKDEASELQWLTKLARLAEHDGSVYRRLSELLLAGGQTLQAKEAAVASVYADMEAPESYVALAKAEDALGHFDLAEHAFVSAVLCPVGGERKAAAHEAFAEYHQRRGRGALAKEQRELAAEALKQ